MRTLHFAGRVFYGFAIVVLGFLTIQYHDFPYMLIPPAHACIPNHYFYGALLVLAGACISFNKKVRAAALVLGSTLLLVFCFYFVPWQVFKSPDFRQFTDWENAAKELALASGAFVMLDNFPRQIGKKPFFAGYGTIFFALTIISFGIDHFLYGKDAADYVPSWIPFHIFWIYFTGTALLGSGIAIILKIRTSLIAGLLGTMIFSWFIILHIPRIISFPAAPQRGYADQS